MFNHEYTRKATNILMNGNPDQGKRILNFGRVRRSRAGGNLEPGK